MQKWDKANNTTSNLEIFLSGMISLYKPKQSRANMFERIFERFYLGQSQPYVMKLGLEGVLDSCQIAQEAQGLVWTSYSIS